MRDQDPEVGELMTIHIGASHDSRPTPTPLAPPAYQKQRCSSCLGIHHFLSLEPEEAQVSCQSIGVQVTRLAFSLDSQVEG